MPWLKREKSTKKSFANWFGTIALLALSACAIPIKNQRWYGDAGPDGAFYVETLTDAEGQVAKPDWDTLRFGMMCTDPQNFADTKAVIEKLCHQTGNCTYEEMERLTEFFSRMDLMQRRIEWTSRPSLP